MTTLYLWREFTAVFPAVLTLELGRNPSRLFGWLNTTMHHDRHHQNAHFNYGLYFSWWDRFMSTEDPEYQVRVAEIATRSRRGEKLSPTANVLAAFAFAFFVGVTAAVKGL